MIPKIKTCEITLNRTIPASAAEVYDAWLDPSHPGTPFNSSQKLILDPKVDAAFYFLHIMEGTELPHFGRFIVLDRSRKIQYSWMSRHTRGLESIVTVTFQAKGGDTLLTLNHANIPDDEMGHAHEQGWTHYLGLLEKHFAPTRQKEKA